MKSWKKLAVGSILALGIAGASPVAQAAPAGAGTIGVERSAPASAVEKVHYRHYRHCHRHRGHVDCHGARRHHHYRSAGIYLNFGPTWGWGNRHHHHRHHYRHHHHRHHRHW